VPTPIPTLLVIAGHDPTGLAGLTADIETAQALGVRPVSLVTALTVQGLDEFVEAVPTSAETLTAAFRVLAAETRFDAIKVGFVPDAEVARAVAALLDAAEGVPVVLDPVVSATADARAPDAARRDAIRRDLVPRATLATPNRGEAARLLARTNDDALSIEALHGLGVPAVVVTGADSGTGPVVHDVSLPGRAPYTLECARLPGRYRGSGCTFSSAIASQLALGEPLAIAIERGQAFTHAALAAGHEVAPGVFRPARRQQTGAGQ